MADGQENTLIETAFGVYIHWPYCASKCPYCDFNSHVVEDRPEADWLAALLIEIRGLSQHYGRRPVSSIFFGGGTPSLMSAGSTAAVIDALQAQLTLANDCEITLEANPSSTEAAKLADFRAAGINRLSLGVQSFDDQALQFLGRRHDAETARRAVADARRVFDNMSFDLMYARLGQSWQAWRQELDLALTLAPDHISLYQLTIEAGTPFALRAAQGEALTLDDSAAAEMFQNTRQYLAAAGLPAYEVSNHARAGAQARHNLTYWRYQPYAGLGPGAHGRLPWPDPCGREGRLATQKPRHPRRWMDAVQEDPAADGLGLTPQERFEEALLMGLRLTEGVDLERLAGLGDAPWQTWIVPSRLTTLEAEKLLRREGTRLQVTEAGFLTLNAIIRYLLAAAPATRATSPAAVEGQA
jgi:putative oxygen-independent coproporphyrinogen III oxidase